MSHDTEGYRSDHAKASDEYDEISPPKSFGRRSTDRGTDCKNFRGPRLSATCNASDQGD